VVVAAAQRQEALGLRRLADRQAGGDLAVQRHAASDPQQHQLGRPAGPAGRQPQVPLARQRVEVLAQGGVADAEAAGELGELGRPAVARLGLAQGVEDAELLEGRAWHRASSRDPG